MTKRVPLAEPLFWVALLVGLIGFPLLLAGDANGLRDLDVVFGSVVLLGFAAFGFGASLLVAAYAEEGMHPVLILAAALGALAGGLFATALAGELPGGLRIFAFTVLIVDGAGLAAAPRAWRSARARQAGIVATPEASTQGE